MIEEGTKVETDTSRTMSESSFDAAFADDSDNEVPAAVVDSTVQDGAQAAAEPESAVPGVGSPETVSSSAAPALPDGYKLDSLGRLHGPDGRVVSKDEAAKILTPEAAPVVAAPAAKPSPFQYRAFGETKALDGFEQYEDGSVKVAPEKVSELRHLYSMQESFTQQSRYIDQVKARNAELEREVQNAKTGQTAEIARANALVETYSKLLSEPDDLKAVEGFLEYRTKFPLLLEKARANYYEQLAKQGRPEQRETNQPERAPEVSAPPTREIAWETTQDYIERFKIEHTLRDVSPDDWKQFEARASRNPHAYTRPASPEEAQRLGLAPNSYVFDDVALKADIDDYAKQLRTVRETAKARQFNASSQTPTPATPGKPKPRPAAAVATSRGPSFDEAWNTEDD